VPGIFLDEQINVFESRQANASASVWIFARFYNPYFFSLILVLFYEVTILLIFWWFDMISFWNVIKRIFISYSRVVMKKWFEEIFLGPNTIVTRQVISDSIRYKYLWKRHNETFFGYIILNCSAFLWTKYFSVVVSLLLGVTHFANFVLTLLPFVDLYLLIIDFVDDVLRPIEVDATIFKRIHYLPPKTSLHQTFQK